MDSTLVGNIIMGLARDGLKAVGGGLVTQGVITNSQENIVIGAVLAIIPVIFSVVSNMRKTKAQAVVKAVEAHPGITVTPASQTLTGKPVVTVVPVMPPKSLV